jgi:hypothetical protein
MTRIVHQLMKKYEVKAANNETLKDLQSVQRSFLLLLDKVQLARIPDQTTHRLANDALELLSKVIQRLKSLDVPRDAAAESVTAKNKPFFGTVDKINWAMCIDTLEDNSFPTKPFGHQLNDLRKFQEFTKSAKKLYVGTKGKASLPSVKKEIKERGLKQFAARWGADSSGYKDDSVIVYYV